MNDDGSYRVACLDVWPETVQQVVADVAPAGFEVVFAGSYEAPEQHALVAGADFVMAGWAAVPAAAIVAAPHLKLIQKWGVGFDRIDLETARARAVPVAIVSGVNAPAVAEHAIALMLAVYRRLPLVDAAARRGVWLKSRMRAEAHMLKGKTIGILGLGRIGRAVAQRLAGFEAELLCHDIVPPPLAVLERLTVRHVSFEQLLVASDVLSVHVPLDAGTRGLIGREALLRMKPGAVLVNTARGGVVDEAALAEAVAEGRLYGAGLDVFATEPLPADAPLLAEERTVVTPHTAGVVFDIVEPMARHAFDNMLRILHGRPLDPDDVVIG